MQGIHIIKYVSSYTYVNVVSPFVVYAMRIEVGLCFFFSFFFLFLVVIDRGSCSASDGKYECRQMIYKVGSWNACPSPSLET